MIDFRGPWCYSECLPWLIFAVITEVVAEKYVLILVYYICRKKVGDDVLDAPLWCNYFKHPPFYLFFTWAINFLNTLLLLC